jgi:hypothetical protein
MSDLLLSISSSADGGGVVWRDSAPLPCRREHDRPSVTRWRLSKIAHSAFHAKQQLGQLRKMTISKMTFFGVAGLTAAVISSGALAWVHNGATPADQGNATNYVVVGQDGRLIGATPNASIRSLWERGRSSELKAAFGGMASTAMML